MPESAHSQDNDQQMADAAAPRDQLQEQEEHLGMEEQRVIVVRSLPVYSYPCPSRTQLTMMTAPRRDRHSGIIPVRRRGAYLWECVTVLHYEEVHTLGW